MPINDSSSDQTAFHRTNRGIVGAITGNALEWFDFVLFGLFALPIAKAFFPSQTEYGSLLKSVSIFGVGFVARPIGAIVLGWYGDRFGRKPALVLAILLMMLGTGLVATTPSYASIGLAAPIVIVIARLIQGFSVGGEFGSVTIYLIETGPKQKRALSASLQMIGQFSATFIAVMLGALASKLLNNDQLFTWGWRVPFLVGLLIGPVALYFRAIASEPSEFAQSPRRTSRPLAELLRHHTGAVFITFGLTVSGTISTYVLLIYMPTYAVQHLSVKFADSFTATAIGAFVGLLCCPLAGWLADRYGHMKVMGCATLLTGLAVYPLFALVAWSPSLGILSIAQGCLAILLAAYAAPALSIGAALFPTEVRASGLSIGYNAATLAFGATALALVTWITKATGNAMAAPLYVAFGAVVTLIALVLASRRHRTL